MPQLVPTESGTLELSWLTMKQIAKWIMARTPYRLVREYGINRFQAIDQSLRDLRKRGFRPMIVIDGGAHLGTFSLAAERIFPEATFHLIEPQPACLGPLRELSAKRHFALHEFALSDRPGTVEFLKTTDPNTGAYVNPRGEEAITVPANTLDALFAGRVATEMRPLLKLDLQGHELAALKGGVKTLQSIEAVLIEVNFVPFLASPGIPSIISFFDENEFELYDVASLSGQFRDNRLVGGDLIFARRDSELMADLAG
jgi:FkbM family methyltransferase